MLSESGRHFHLDPPRGEIYFDNNATTAPTEAVKRAVLDAMGASFGNPSSGHSAGARAAALVARARASVAELIGVPEEQVVFTSGATESNSLVLTSLLYWPKARKRVVTSTTEHSSISRACEFLERHGFDVIRLPANRNGEISPSDLTSALELPVDLVSLQWVNSETGVLQPIEQLSAICARQGVLFHTDAAQAAGKLTINAGSLAIAFLSLSGHKFHAPQGVGALYVANARRVVPQLHGGEQERGLRAGTENVPGIAGLGEAARSRAERLKAFQEHASHLRSRIESRLREEIPGIVVNGAAAERVCNTTNIQFPDVDGQALVSSLDALGIRCSQSSACTNNRPEPSHVLRAMGLSEKAARSSVRFSFSEYNTLEQVDKAVEAVIVLYARLRAFGATHRNPEHAVRRQ